MRAWERIAVLLSITTLAFGLPPAETETDALDSFVDARRQWQWPIGALGGTEDDASKHPPSHPHHVATNKTIYQLLTSRPEFSKLTKVVNISDEVVALLNSTSTNLTFFAVPDWALPKRPSHNRTSSHRSLVAFEQEELQNEPSLDALAAAADAYETGFVPEHLERLITALLSYHILPTPLTSGPLTINTTYETKLVLPWSGRAHRLRVSSSLVGGIRINFGSKIVFRDVRTANGVVHVLSAPLLPPPGVFHEAFLFPKVFSYATTALQRANLSSLLDFTWGGKHSENTIFLPTNDAFEKLPIKLKHFLFSPFGTKVLGKLLAYHVVPNVTLHADTVFNATAAAEYISTGALAESTEPLYETELGEDVDFGAYGRETDRFHSHSKENAMMYELHHDSLHLALEHSTTERPARVTGDESNTAFSFVAGKVARLLGLDKHRSPKDRTGPPPPPPRKKGGRRPPGKGRRLSHPPPPPPRHVAPPPHHHCTPPGEHQHPHRGPSRARTGLPHPKPYLSFNLTVPTALTNQSLTVQIAKFNFTLPHLPSKFVTAVTVNGHPVAVADIPALNGAIHVVDWLLVPSHHAKNLTRQESWADMESSHGMWEGWEHWLLDWADQH